MAGAAKLGSLSKAPVPAATELIMHYKHVLYTQPAAKSSPQGKTQLTSPMVDGVTRRTQSIVAALSNTGHTSAVPFWAGTGPEYNS